MDIISPIASYGPSEGILYHSCGPAAGGWHIADIWEWQEAFDRFVDAKYLPAIWANSGPGPSQREVVVTYYAGAVIRS